MFVFASRKWCLHVDFCLISRKAPFSGTGVQPKAEEICMYFLVSVGWLERMEMKCLGADTAL